MLSSSYWLLNPAYSLLAVWCVKILQILLVHFSLRREINNFFKKLWFLLIKIIAISRDLATMLIISGFFNGPTYIITHVYVYLCMYAKIYIFLEISHNSYFKFSASCTQVFLLRQSRILANTMSADSETTWLNNRFPKAFKYLI